MMVECRIWGKRLTTFTTDVWFLCKMLVHVIIEKWLFWHSFATDSAFVTVTIACVSLHMCYQVMFVGKAFFTCSTLVAYIMVRCVDVPTELGTGLIHLPAYVTSATFAIMECNVPSEIVFPGKCFFYILHIHAWYCLIRPGCGHSPVGCW